METNEDFNQKFESFLAGCNKIKTEHTESRGYLSEGLLTVNDGRRYLKLVESRGGVYCFVDKTNGNVLKAAGWAAPAKGARGNIFDAANGLARMGPYGAAYNKG